MIVDVLVTFAGIGMDQDFDHRGEFVEEGVTHLLRNEVPLQNRLLAVHGDMHFTPQAMPHPADCRAVDIHHTVHVRCDVFELLVDLRVDRIHHAVPHILRGFPHDAQNGDADAEGVGSAGLSIQSSG